MIPWWAVVIAYVIGLALGFFTGKYGVDEDYWR